MKWLIQCFPIYSFMSSATRFLTNWGVGGMPRIESLLIWSMRIFFWVGVKWFWALRWAVLFEAVVPSKYFCRVLRSTWCFSAVVLKFLLDWLFKSTIASARAISLTILCTKIEALRNFDLWVNTWRVSSLGGIPYGSATFGPRRPIKAPSHIISCKIFLTAHQRWSRRPGRKQVII